MIFLETLSLFPKRRKSCSGPRERHGETRPGEVRTPSGIDRATGGGVPHGPARSRVHRQFRASVHNRGDRIDRAGVEPNAADSSRVSRAFHPTEQQETRRTNQAERREIRIYFEFTLRKIDGSAFEIESSRWLRDQQVRVRYLSSVNKTPCVTRAPGNENRGATGARRRVSRARFASEKPRRVEWRTQLRRIRVSTLNRYAKHAQNALAPPSRTPKFTRFPHLLSRDT